MNSSISTASSSPTSGTMGLAPHFCAHIPGWRSITSHNHTLSHDVEGILSDVTRGCPIITHLRRGDGRPITLPSDNIADLRPPGRPPRLFCGCWGKTLFILSRFSKLSLSHYLVTPLFPLTPLWNLLQYTHEQNDERS